MQYTLLKCFLIYQRKFILFQIYVPVVLNSVEVGSLFTMDSAQIPSSLQGLSLSTCKLKIEQVLECRLLGLNGLLYVKHASMDPSTYESQQMGALTDTY